MAVGRENLYFSAEMASKYVKENAGARDIIIKELLRKDINTAYS